MSGVLARMSRGCYEETASVKFKLNGCTCGWTTGLRSGDLLSRKSDALIITPPRHAACEWRGKNAMPTHHNERHEEDNSSVDVFQLRHRWKSRSIYAIQVCLVCMEEHPTGKMYTAWAYVQCWFGEGYGYHRIPNRQIDGCCEYGIADLLQPGAVACMIRAIVLVGVMGPILLWNVAVHRRPLPMNSRQTP